MADDVIDRLRQLRMDVAARDMNEADTRHRVIDFILHDVLAWPRNQVKTEPYVGNGFADYVLVKSNEDPIIFIEAKKDGIYFELPRPIKEDESSTYIRIDKLLTDQSIRAAMTQVRTYCQDTGCEFAAITNGNEWIFFKTFERGKRWETLQAFVVRSLVYFEREYTKAYNELGFVSVTDYLSLQDLLTSSSPKDRSIYYAKDRIPSYSHPITANRLANFLRPVVNHYFGVIGDDDAEFMDRCYVSQRDYEHTFDGMRSVIADSLSPYFEGYGVKQLTDTGKGGALGGKLTKKLKHGRVGEVLVLFGGKGAGKSTFIKRLLHHNPPRWLRDHAVIAIIDLLKVPEEPEVIRKAIWEGLVDRLDPEGLLSAERSTLLDKLFSDRFETANRQELAGLTKASEAYNTQLNGLIASWKTDKRYCAQRLVNYWRSQDKGVIVVVDNTDQYNSSNQNFCFTSAQEIAAELGCVTLISMREERFHSSKIHGLLDAFQNSGFHISSPKPAEVFRKRLEYTKSLLVGAGPGKDMVVNQDTAVVSDSATYLGIISREFRMEKSPLNSFLTACAHGDTRLSLDLFRSFLLSGYTNVEEMLAAGEWNFKIHQVIKPVMIPTRYFYDESLSDIPNIYQLRYNRHSSHFTSLRILRKLSKGVEGSSVSHIPMATLKSYFAETFNMLDDFKRNADTLLRHGFVEADNRIDEYSESVDAMRITGYGLYMLRELSHIFAYLDLVCTDTGVFDEPTSHYLVEAAKKEYKLFLANDRVARVRTRLDRVEKFIDYLSAEESREREFYGLGMPMEDMFTHRCKVNFESEKQIVMASAQRQSAGRRNGSSGSGGGENRRPRRNWKR